MAIRSSGSVTTLHHATALFRAKGTIGRCTMVMDRRSRREEARRLRLGLSRPATSCKLSAPDEMRKVLKSGVAQPYL